MSDGEFQIPDELRRRIEAGEDLFPEKTARAKETLKNSNLNELLFADKRKTKTEDMTGIEMITNERLEQKIVHGRSVKHDVENNANGELAIAAQALLEGDVTWMPKNWTDESCEQMINKSYQERLVMAGALIAAEIDRLNYKP